MAIHNPVRVDRTGLTGKVIEFEPGVDTIPGGVLPDEAIWSDLLVGGFIILTRTPAQDGTAGRRAYVGSISGRASRTYWYDSTARAWFNDAAAADPTNRLIGFGGN